MTDDVKPFFCKGLSGISRIVLAKAFTKYGWLLAIYNALGIVEGDTLIIYYNREEPRWTASTLIHEVIHIALNMNRKSSLDTIVDEALAYVASFKSGFQDLYLEGISQAVEILSSCTNPYEDYELINIVIPRILAHRLTRYNYTHLVEQLIKIPEAVFDFWLETNPEKNEIQALATALKITRIDVKNKLLKTSCREELRIINDVNEYRYEFEGADRDFLKMIELLNKAAKNRQEAYKVLKPWWNELKEIKYELEAYLHIYHESEEEP